VPESQKRASDYTTESQTAARAGLLHLATVLGDLLDDVMVVGGIVPSLIVTTPDDELLGPHVGTTDVDIALALAVLDADRYREIAERMRRAGFHPDVNDAGRETVQRWVLDDALRVTVDFLIPQAPAMPQGQRVHHLESDFGALVTTGMSDALKTRVRVTLSGQTLDGAEAVELAITILRQDFQRFESLGPTRAAAFLANGIEDEVRADVVAHVASLLNGLEDAVTVDLRDEPRNDASS